MQLVRRKETNVNMLVLLYLIFYKRNCAGNRYDSFLEKTICAGVSVEHRINLYSFIGHSKLNIGTPYRKHCSWCYKPRVRAEKNWWPCCDLWTLVMFLSLTHSPFPETIKKPKSVQVYTGVQ